MRTVVNRRLAVALLAIAVQCSSAYAAAQTRQKLDLEERAKRGDPDAEYALAERASADGRDPAAALMWYFRAATHGNKDATAKLQALIKPFVPTPAPQAPEIVVPPISPPQKAAPVPSRPSQRPRGPMALAGMAVLVSLAAVYFSWTHTRRALRDAGLL